ncbi:MAG: hypothetical protein JSS27_11000 [Planctomycetes bacterium]|nr:hypothetical protein [Planctomycetota bacterium]
MKRIGILALAVVAAQLTASDLWAQQARPGNNNNNRQGQGQRQGNNRNRQEEEVKLPDDKRLLEVHRKFVLDAEKLAKEYEKNNELEKARVCYSEIVRLVPTYPGAKEAMEKLFEKQAGAEKKQMDIQSTKGWHDTGVIVAEGKPFRIKADGKWTFRLTAETNADGIEIPEDLKEFNMGALIGYIDDGQSKEIKPFLVGGSYEGKAEKNGKLYLGMYDADGSDNQGRLNVTITGTFYKPNSTGSR